MKNLKKIFFIKSSFIIIRNKFIRTKFNSRILFIPSKNCQFIIYIKLKEIKPRISFSKNERS